MSHTSSVASLVLAFVEHTGVTDAVKALPSSDGTGLTESTAISSQKLYFSITHLLDEEDKMDTSDVTLGKDSSDGSVSGEAPHKLIVVSNVNKRYSSRICLDLLKNSTY
mmetsp:Transcript_3720/g.5763  ORF Transcript_3720/g.5763 Transcript_3720/m.5763 type:complete len:109 (-) Transcript_3720:249-575(-)